MPSFFTTPASQRKRKRPDGSSGRPGSKKRNLTNGVSKARRKPSPTAEDDESITGSESEDDEQPRNADDGGVGNDDDDEASTGSEYEGETAAERRLRLAERYLDNIREEVDTGGFDAAEIDRDLIAERLKEDIAESKGRLYRRIASTLAFKDASSTAFRADTHATTSIAACPPYIYTVSKDRTLIKWEVQTPPSAAQPFNEAPVAADAAARTESADTNPTRSLPPPRRRPKQLAFVKGQKTAKPLDRIGHTDEILAVAASEDGKYVVTGGRDRRLIVWDASSLSPLKAFTQHRDAILALAFRRGTNQLYSASRDRTIKIWSLNELAYVETLFGHQDEIVDVAALAQERCVSVGARDRTARLWKVVEETQLVFRGGGGGGRGGGKKNLKHASDLSSSSSTTTTPQSYTEGSIDRVALIDEETFVTGSDSGSLALWTLHKKKAIFTVALAHGLDPPPAPDEASAEKNPDPTLVYSERQPRWITALAAVPYSDLVLSGSWDGHVRVWRVAEDRKRLEPVGVLGREEEGGEPGDGGGGDTDGQTHAIVDGPMHAPTEGREAKEQQPPRQLPPARGVINDITVFERGERGEQGLCVVVALGKDHRLGRWRKFPGKNGAVVFEVPKRASPSISASTETSATLN